MRAGVKGGSGNTSDSGVTESPPFFPHSGYQEFPGWHVAAITSQRGSRRPVRADALTIQMLPVFLTPRDAYSFNDWANVSLETACAPFSVTQSPFRSIVPTFWACSTAATRTTPLDPSVQRLIVYLMRSWMARMELTWDVSSDFLMRWSAQHRIATVYPLISTLLNNDTAHMSSRSIAELAYRPTIIALQDAYTCTTVTTIDLTPLLCFVTGQFFPPGFPSPRDYPPNTLSLITPRTLSPPQCELLLRVTRRWKSFTPYHPEDRSTVDIAKHLVEAWHADPEPTTPMGYLPSIPRARSHQRVTSSMIHIRPLSLDSSEASFAGLIPLFLSLLHVQRPSAPDERRMT